MINSTIYNSPIGPLFIGESQGAITHILFGTADFSSEQKPSILLDKAVCQLREYFEGKRRTFALPLKLIGTEFRKTVWQALLAVPYGETATYGHIAQMIGNPKACRAVGGANHYNPISIIVP